MSGDAAIARLEHGRLALSRVTISGPLDFGTLHEMQYAFSCRRCRIAGAVSGEDVVFAGTLDLSRTTFDGPVRMHGASFRAPAVFAATSFEQSVDFSLATFGDLASFERATFAREGTFATARFRDVSVFLRAGFSKRVSFARAAFGGAADFRGTDFAAPARFDAASFGSRADFGLATFESTASFSDARFGSAGAFHGAQFFYSGSRDGVALDGASAASSLDFDLATFWGRGNFQDADAAGGLSFDDAEFAVPRERQFVFAGFSAGSLKIGVSDVFRVVQTDDRERVLRLVEATAKERGDLGVANDAYYQRKIIESARLPWYDQVLNVFFYRLVAGYFVRPLHPLIALVLVATSVSLLRVMTIGTRRPRWSYLTRATGGLRRAWHELLDALALIAPRRGEGADEKRRGRRVEAFLYRVLLVCALIGFANSNPTLRQMFDALL